MKEEKKVYQQIQIWIQSINIRLNTPKENLWEFIMIKAKTILKNSNISFESGRNRGERKSKRKRGRVGMKD